VVSGVWCLFIYIFISNNVELMYIKCRNQDMQLICGRN